MLYGGISKDPQMLSGPILTSTNVIWRKKLAKCYRDQRWIRNQDIPLLSISPYSFRITIHIISSKQEDGQKMTRITILKQ